MPSTHTDTYVKLDKRTHKMRERDDRNMASVGRTVGCVTTFVVPVWGVMAPVTWLV